MIQFDDIYFFKWVAQPPTSAKMLFGYILLRFEAGHVPGVGDPKSSSKRGRDGVPLGVTTRESTHPGSGSQQQLLSSLDGLTGRLERSKV